MVRIVKGQGADQKCLTVPLATYKNFYEGAGWTLDEGSKTNTVEEIAEDKTIETNNEEDEWDSYEEEEYTKPLSEMNRAELEAYASQLNVDLTGLSSNKQMREAIKAVL